MPSWEKRICRQHGLFIDGSNLNLVYDNIIDRFYFRLKGRAFGAPREFADNIDFDLLRAEEWLESIINDFIIRHFGEQ